MVISLRKSALTAVVWLAALHVGFAQNTLETFGKNRIQYKNFEWKQISTTNFDIYYYQDGNDIAYLAARYAEADFDRIADILGYTPYAKTKVFIYNSVTDLQQSNVGLSEDNLVLGGQTNFVKSRVEIPFPGSVSAFKDELSLGIARMFIVEMMFGGSLRDMVQSSFLLTLPDWFVSGAAAYVATGWSAEMDDYMRDAVLNKNLRKPSLLSDESAVIVGQSLWNFIAERYGRSNISNILNLTRIIRNEENSIASTIGLPYNRFIAEWRKYYSDMAQPIAQAYPAAKPDFILRKNRRNKYVYNDIAVSPDGKSLAFSESVRGRYRVYVRSTDRKRRAIIMVGGYKTINQRVDPGIPLLDWRDDKTLVVIHAKRGENYISQYDISRGNRRISRKPLDRFNQIKDFDVSDDGRSVVLSADRDGKNDIFIYDLGRNAIRAVTNDLYDDRYPQFLPNSSTAVVFSSNRQNDTLNATNVTFREVENRFDLFVYNPDKSTTALERIAYSPGNETQARVAGTDTLFYLSDVSGIQQLYGYDFSSGETAQISRFRQNIQSYDVNPATGRLAYQMINDGRNQVMFSRKYDFSGNGVQPVRTRRSEILLERSGTSFTPPPTTSTKPSAPAGTTKDTTNAAKNTPSPLALEAGEVDTDNYQFDISIADQSKPKESQDGKTRRTLLNSAKSAANRPQNVTIRGPFPYQNRFSADNVVSSVLIDPLRGLGVLFTISMNDVLENHKLSGGLLGFTDLKSSNFFGEYQYLKYRADFGARYDRKTIFINGDNNVYQRYTLNKIQLTASYPLSVTSRVTLAPFYASTRYTEITPAPPNTFELPDLTTGFAGLRAEFVFDNTSVNGLNMMEGTRAKIKFENYSALSSSAQNFNAFTIDLRNYKRLHRDIIFATRLAYGQFGGNDRKTYAMGGMDNWIFNQRERYGDNDPFRVAAAVDNRDLLFLEFVTPLRGFSYNKLFGDKFLLFNAELRFPIIKYFYRGPITSNFFKNFQLVAFTDIGAAWTGRGPFSRQNSLNTSIVERRPFRASVTNFKNPFLSGHGVGVRTLLLGYYVKFDVAWGVEDYNIISDSPRFYLTLGYDF